MIKVIELNVNASVEEIEEALKGYKLIQCMRLSYNKNNRVTEVMRYIVEENLGFSHGGIIDGKKGPKADVKKKPKKKAPKEKERTFELEKQEKRGK